MKIQNDGFDLGAQRREIDKNDLPQALEVITKYKEALKGNEKFELNGEQEQITHLVSKDKIAESGDYNLMGDKYKVDIGFTNKKWPLVKLGDVILDIKDGGTPSRRNSKYFGRDIYWCVVKDIKPEIWDTAEKITKLGLENSSAKVWPIDSIIISLGATIGNVGIAKVSLATKQGLSGIVVDKNKVLPKFLYHILASKRTYIQSLATGVTIKEVRPSKLKELFMLPLPPLEVQKEIVEQIEVKQKAIDAAKAVIDNLEKERRYFGQSLRKIEGIEWVELKQVAEVVAGQSPKGKYYNEIGEGTPFYQGKTEFTGKYLGKARMWTTKTTKIAEHGDILMSVRAPVGPVNIATEKICIGRGLASIRATKINQMFLFNFLKSIEAEIKGGGGAVFDSISKNQIEKVKILLPPLETQKQLVAEMEEQEKIIEANKKLIGIMEQKIGEVLSEI